MTARWAKLDSLRWKADRGTPEQGCRYCLNCGQGDVDCPLATCKACGTVQCLRAGCGGRCGVCLVGIVEGWSGADRPCGYKGCPNRAVAEAPRARSVCAEHALRAKSSLRPATVWEYIMSGLDHRGEKWALVDFGERGKNSTSF